MSIEAWIAIGIAVVLIIYAIVIYNTLNSYREQYKNGYSQIDVQLKRRHDLIPNLVNTAKAYMKHEAETLTAVTEARAKALQAADAARTNPGDPKAMAALGSAEGELMATLGNARVAFEAYPDLKADANMRQLSEELTTTENRVAYARQGYNDLVQKFNEYRKSFPAIVLAGLFGFREDAGFMEYDDIAEARQAPVVAFD